MKNLQIKKAANTLIKLFPKTEKEPTYSLGFQRWTTLTLEQRKVLIAKHNKKELSYAKVYKLCINELQYL